MNVRLPLPTLVGLLAAPGAAHAAMVTITSAGGRARVSIKAVGGKVYRH